MMCVDQILRETGGLGRHQWTVFVLIGLVCLRNAWHTFAPVFLAALPPHHCISPVNSTNVTDECRYVNSTMTCEEWRFDPSYGSTIVTEWLLICDRAGLVPLSTSCYMCGVMFGAVFLTPLADTWGRKRFMIGCAVLQSLIGAGLMSVDGIELFCAVRFALGALNQCVSISGYVLLAESIPSNSRTVPCILVNVFWPVGMVLLALLAYSIRNWRYLQLAISLPSLLLLSYHWLLSESLPWLISKNKTEEVEREIERISRTNRKPVFRRTILVVSDDANGQSDECGSPEHEVAHVDASDSAEQVVRSDNLLVDTAVESRENARGSIVVRYPCLLLYSTRRMALYTSIVFFLWFVNSLLYYGLSFSMPKLSGDPYANFTLVSLVEVPAQIVSMFTLMRFGRRPVLACSYVGGGLALILSVLLIQFAGSGTLVVVICGLVGKFCVTITLITVWLYSTEVFPTGARNSSVGLASFWETLGSIAAPFVVYSERSLWYLPPSLYGVMSIVAGLLTLLLPETHNKPLPRSVADVQRMKQS